MTQTSSPPRADAAPATRWPCSLARRAAAWIAAALLCASGHAGAAISYVGSSTTATNSIVGSVAVARPTGVNSGDVMLALIATRGGGSVTAPTGWALVRTTNDGTLQTMALYSRVATASEAASYTWTLGASDRTAAAIVAYSGVDTSSPVNVSGAQVNGAAASYTAPSVATTTNGAMVVALFSATNGNGSVQAVSGMTMAYSAGTGMAGNGVVIGASYATQATAGASGSKASTANTSATNIGTLVALKPAAVLIAKYDFNESSYAGTAGELKDGAGYTGGPFNGKAQGSAVPTVASASPARSGSPGTCSYASLPGPTSNGAGFIIAGLPVSATSGDKTSVAFWMYWDGTNSVMPIGWLRHDLWLNSGHFGFNTGSGDLYGISSAGLSGGWNHVVAVFTNGGVTSNRIYINGVQQTLTQRLGSPSNATAVVNTTLRIGGWGTDTGYRMAGRIDQVRVYNGELNSTEVSAAHAETSTCSVVPPHHLELQHASGTGLTCTPSTVTVKACADAVCSAVHTGGVTGTLSATGGSVTWPSTAAFSIPAGSSSTTVSLQSTTTTATLLGVVSSMPTASNAATCNFGSPACTFTAADAGFVFDVPHHVSELAQTVSVSAVRKSDSSTVCTPAFASTSKAVTFSCAYTNPATGTLPVRVGGTAANASASAAAACDAGGRAVTLAFNASGVASTTVQYADVGQVLLSARYAGAAGGSEAGLVMTGSDSFIAAPDSFSITGVTAGPIKAGSSFAATVTARNSAGNATPNHGRESSAESVTLGWVRLQPTGSGAVNGSFSGSLGAFGSGAASASNLAWTEVGRGDLLARSASTSGYLGSGQRAFGSSLATGARQCATEDGSCVLPGGTTASVYYGENGSFAVKAAQTGSVACTNANFGDPLPGTAKRCFYAASAASNGSVGDFIPHRFSVAASHACGTFTYAGQPIATTVTAQNAAGSTTVNFNGTATTTPSLAQAVTLSEPSALGLGALSGNSIAASAFSGGVASATPAYAFTSKTTAPQSLVLRASNGAAGAALISSQGGAEPTLPLRSGRLRLSNAFGKTTAALQLAATTDYWGGSAWLLNGADNCTTVAAASVVLSNPRSATGAASTASTSASALVISGGSGSISLAAPSPAGSSLSLDLAVNLGSTGTDQSCLGSHPASTGAGKPWLRAQNGSCAASADRDPAARASFGIFSPETRKTVHVREIF